MRPFLVLQGNQKQTQNPCWGFPKHEPPRLEALQLPMDLATDLAWVHQQRPEDIDYELVLQAFLAGERQMLYVV